MIVCIAEKPSVALEIARVLGARTRKDGYYEGGGYQVTWTFGHLCELQSPDDYSSRWAKWSLFALPIIPGDFSIQLIKHKGIRKQFGIIKKLFSKATEIINCGDAGQEGELIQRWVQQLAKPSCPIKRLWISSLTEDAIRDGFRHLLPQSQYDNLYMAGLARACGDWLMGMNLTRLYTLKYAPEDHLYSIGRVQTPTLAMIAAREGEIEDFIPKPYWTVSTKYRGLDFSCVKGRFDSRQEAEAVLASISGKPLTIIDVKTKETIEQPPQLYDLTSLQVELNSRYGYPASESLSIIQSLYEKKVSTYPRVDTRYLSDDIYPRCPKILSSLTQYKAINGGISLSSLPKSRRAFNSAKVTDHHAIIPTGRTAALTDKESKVFDLICRRFISVFMNDTRYHETEYVASCGNVQFKARVRKISVMGWKAACTEDVKQKEKEPVLFPDIRNGESGTHEPSISRKQTTPPRHYTEATLLRDMETAGKFVTDGSLREYMKDGGIGRPSSRASIIETLIRRGYVRRQGKELLSTPEGRKLIGLVEFPILKSPSTTAEWEKRLREIEQGRYTCGQFIAGLSEQIEDIVRSVRGRQ